MRIAKIMVSKAVLESFFQTSDRAFLCHKGVPDDADLVRFQYVQKLGHWVATFKHHSFTDIDVDGGQKAPFLDVEYTQLQIVKEPVAETNPPEGVSLN